MWMLCDKHASFIVILPTEWGLLAVGLPSEDTPEIHVGLRKAKSSILTQIRTGRVGLASFLNRARVPDFASSKCQCGQEEETAAHIIACCPRFAEQRRSLANPLTGRQDVQALRKLSRRSEETGEMVLKTADSASVPLG